MYNVTIAFRKHTHWGWSLRFPLLLFIIIIPFNIYISLLQPAYLSPGALCDLLSSHFESPFLTCIPRDKELNYPWHMSYITTTTPPHWTILPISQREKEYPTCISCFSGVVVGISRTDILLSSWNTEASRDILRDVLVSYKSGGCGTNHVT